MPHSPPPLRLHNLLLLLLLFCSYFSSSHSKNPTELVKKICKNTTTYGFCVNSLYSDPRTPTADAYVLAFISFDLAYANATRTNAHVQALLSREKNPDFRRLLKSCEKLYGEAVSALALALNDLDSETYSELASYAGDSAREAGECQKGFRGTRFRSPFTQMNRDLRGLAGICIVVSNLFTS